MTEEFQDAKPVGFGRNLPRCRVYAAEQTGPPLKLRPAEIPHCSHIAIELLDYEKVAARELAGIEEVPILRLGLHASDARWFCVALVHALTHIEDDPQGIAHQMEQAFLKILDENRPQSG